MHSSVAARMVGASTAPVVDEDDTGGVEFVCVVRRGRIKELIPRRRLGFLTDG